MLNGSKTLTDIDAKQAHGASTCKFYNRKSLNCAADTEIHLTEAQRISSMFWRMAGC